MDTEKVKYLQKARWNSEAEYYQVKKKCGEDSGEAKAAEAKVIALTEMIEREYEDELDWFPDMLLIECEDHGECIILHDADLCVHEDYMDIYLYIMPLHINFDKLQGCNEDTIKELERLNQIKLFSEEDQIARKEIVREMPTRADWCPVRSVCLWDQKIGEAVDFKELLDTLETVARNNNITIKLN